MSATGLDIRSKVIDEVEDAINSDVTRNEKLMKICEILEDEVGVFDWVGFYLVDPEAEKELVLGPFVGERTDHKRIPFGKGICGQAAESRETYVSQDVTKEENYLACSVDVMSEIVVPVIKGDRLIGELDIDSHTKNAITDEHREMLEEICEMVSELY